MSSKQTGESRSPLISFGKESDAGRTAAMSIQTMLAPPGPRGSIIVTDPPCEILSISKHQLKLMACDTIVFTFSSNRSESTDSRKEGA